MEQRRPSDGAGEEAGFSGWRRMMVRLLHLYFRLTRSITFGVRAAVLTEAGEVFLIRHTYVPGWQLPGGGVEVGETALQAANEFLASAFPKHYPLTPAGKPREA